MEMDDIIGKDDIFIENEETDVDETDEVIDDNILMSYDIAVFYNTYNLSTLLKWWGTKLIIPKFQRSYVWKIKEASEFVDSILRGLPVPSMFFYDDTDNNRLLVVDGQQRLHSLYAFIKEEKYGNRVFKLTGNIHPNWAGKTYSQLLDEDKDRLDDALLNITVMRQLAPDDGHSAMYLAFQRINTGGISLRAQEIRMAVSYGELAIKLDELSRDERFERWAFLRNKTQRENMNYSPVQEFILKFWTYYFSYPCFVGNSTRTMIDVFFDNQKDLDNPKRRFQGVNYYSWAELFEAFNAVFDVVNALPDDCISPYSKPTQTYLEAIWVGLTYRKLRLGKSINTKTLPEYILDWKEKIGRDKFSELFQARRTSSTKSAYERINAGIEYFKGEF